MRAHSVNAFGPVEEAGREDGPLAAARMFAQRVPAALHSAPLHAPEWTHSAVIS